MKPALLLAAVAALRLHGQGGDPSSVAGKWKNFVGETVDPLTMVGAAFNAAISQAGDADPRYGQGWGPYAQRFGASYADTASQNFFGDFLLASALHEDPRYHRLGSGHSIWHRAFYAISRSVIIRRDSGGDTFNWSNVIGTAMSTGLSNAYYPAASRTSDAMTIHFTTSVVGTGFVNLAFEFWPDFRKRLLHH